MKNAPIIFIITKPGLGGATKSTLELISALRSIGQKASIAYTGSWPNPLPLVPAACIKAINQPDRHTARHLIERALIRFATSYTSRALKVIRRAEWLIYVELLQNYKVIVTAKDPITDWISILLASQAGFEVFCFIRSAPPNISKRNAALISLVRQHANGFIANSEATRTDWIEAGLPRETIRVIPNRLDVSKYDVQKTQKTLRYRSGRITIAAVGRLVPLKRYEDILLALGEIETKYQGGVTLSIVGEGPQEHSLRGLACRLGVSKRVRFFGYLQSPFQDAMPFDVLVVSSEREGFGRTALEAMAVGIPVIATQVGGLKELVSPGNDGILYSPGDIEGLTKAILKLRDDPGLRRNMGVKGRRKVENSYNLSQSARELIDTIRQIS